MAEAILVCQHGLWIIGYASVDIVLMKTFIFYVWTCFSWKIYTICQLDASDFLYDSVLSNMHESLNHLSSNDHISTIIYYV